MPEAISVVNTQRRPGLIEGLDWYALRTTPTKEFTVQQRLERHGVQTFLPCYTVWRGVNKFRRTKVERRYALLTGYVLAGFNADPPPWLTVMEIEDVKSVVGMGDVPHKIPTLAVQALARNHIDGMYAAPLEHRWMRTRHEFGPGDVVQLATDAFANYDVTVEQITGNKARVALRLFGTEINAEVSTFNLVKDD